MTPLQIARRQYNLAEKRHAAAQICGQYDMSAKQTLRMARAAENLRKWAGALRRAEQDHENAKRRACIVCGEQTTHGFFCPCDLSHPICAHEHRDIVPRLDCAFIRSGRGHYNTVTGRG